MSRNPDAETPYSRSSIISRFAASTALLAAAIVLVAVIFFQSILQQVFKEAFKTPLAEWSAHIAGRISGDQETARAIARTHHIGIVVHHGDKVYAFGTDGENAIAAELLIPNSKYRQIEVYAGPDQKFTFILDKKDFTVDHNPLLIALLIMLLLIIGVVYMVQLQQLKPLKWLRSGVDAVSRGDFTKRVPVVRRDEIGEVAQSFNMMVRRVEQMMEDRERLLADVSHELRSPLARIKIALELLPESNKCEAIQTDVREMESLISVLLDREQMKSRMTNLNIESVELIKLVSSVIAGFNNSLPGVNFQTADAEILFNCDPTLIKILLHNLIDNALKFSAESDQTVDVILVVTTKGLQIRVEDKGIGIPEDKLTEIFDAFVKLDPARGHRQGYGLGLNICQRIVVAHDGTINIQSKEKSGTKVTVSFPN